MISIASAIPAVAFCLLPAAAVQIAILARVARSRLGERRECFVRTLRLQFLGVMACTPVLIALNYIRDFDLLVRFAISGVGVLGFYIALHDMYFARLGGLYDNGIVWRGAIVYFDELDFIEKPDPFTVVFQTRDRTRTTVVMNDRAAADRVAAYVEGLLGPS